MTTHVFPGLGCVPLINYLAALGVAKGISEQADPAARFGWRDGVFHMDTEVEDVADFFVRDFVPTPVFSPWNGGSGFGEKDKTPLEYIRILESSTAHRLAPYRNALAVIRSVLIAKSEKDGRRNASCRNFATDFRTMPCRGWTPAWSSPRKRRSTLLFSVQGEMMADWISVQTFTNA